MQSLLKNLIILLLFGLLIFIFRDRVEMSVMQAVNQYLPCRTPIKYSIGTFDSDFNISKEEFIKAVQEAEAIWEKPSGKDLFVFTEEVRPSNLMINLIYDSRQEVTDSLKQIDKKLDTSRSSYDELKFRYEELKSSYEKEKEAYFAKLEALEIRQSKFQYEVEEVNQRGASQEEYTRLQQEQESINREVSVVNKLQTELNAKVVTINNMVVELNQMAEALNLDVKKFNEIGSLNGEEFEEGIYIRDINGTRINIYQFENKAKLVRVLAHELGHALSLGHIDNPKAIMYRLNTASNKELTNEDISALETRCASW